MRPIQPATKAYQFPQLELAAGKVQSLLSLHGAVVHGRCRYKLGAKVEPIQLPEGEFHEVDCSGYVRWLLTRIGVAGFPDGSVMQHDAVKAAGFKRSDVPALKACDGALRIAFLPPKGRTPGHVALWLGGYSIESHGGVGPDRRTVAQSAWLENALVYVLTAPVPRK